MAVAGRKGNKCVWVQSRPALAEKPNPVPLRAKINLPYMYIIETQLAPRSKHIVPRL